MSVIGGIHVGRNQSVYRDDDDDDDNKESALQGAQPPDDDEDDGPPPLDRPTVPGLYDEPEITGNFQQYENQANEVALRRALSERITIPEPSSSSSSSSRSYEEQEAVKLAELMTAYRSAKSETIYTTAIVVCRGTERAKTIDKSILNWLFSYGLTFTEREARRRTHFVPATDDNKSRWGAMQYVKAFKNVQEATAKGRTPDRVDVDTLKSNDAHKARVAEATYQGYDFKELEFLPGTRRIAKPATRSEYKAWSDNKHKEYMAHSKALDEGELPIGQHEILFEETVPSSSSSSMPPPAPRSRGVNLDASEDEIMKFYRTFLSIASTDVIDAETPQLYRDEARYLASLPESYQQIINDMTAKQTDSLVKDGLKKDIRDDLRMRWTSLNVLRVLRSRYLRTHAYVDPSWYPAKAIDSVELPRIAIKRKPESSSSTEENATTKRARLESEAEAKQLLLDEAKLKQANESKQVAMLAKSKEAIDLERTNIAIATALSEADAVKDDKSAYASVMRRVKKLRDRRAALRKGGGLVGAMSRLSVSATDAEIAQLEDDLYRIRRELNELDAQEKRKAAPPRRRVWGTGGDSAIR
jgi:hypothetical protein